MLNNIKATVIVDNIASEELQGEWGLAIEIKAADKSILLDVGSSKLFAKNAEKLGVSIHDVDYAVLSHAHYDHSRGMKEFFRLNSKAKFYLQEKAAENCYHRRKYFRVYIGLPRRITTKFADRISRVSGDYRLCDDVYLIPHHTEGLGAMGVREKMYQKTKDGWKPDDFSHEQSLVFDTKKGLIIFNSCSHGGAANIINEVAAVFPNRPVYGIIGGFHLHNKTEAEVRSLAKKIDETGIQYVCTGHCTKERAYGILKQELGDKLHQLHVGMVMEL